MNKIKIEYFERYVKKMRVFFLLRMIDLLNSECQSSKLRLEYKIAKK